MAQVPPATALTEFVLKVHARCDLACDHCYVYEHRDTSWSRRPRSMSPETVRVAAERIAEHAAAHRLERVAVILHGGEPLLLGPARMRATLAELRRVIEPVTRLDLGMQTNGVLLSERFAEVLLEAGVRVGVSLDGDRAANDLHRRFRNGASSYDRVLAALATLRRPRYRSLYSGLLCTVDVRADPLDVYRALVAQEPPRIDFLLPHSTWDDPPPRPDSGTATPYADWLSAVYDQWRRDGRPTRVRLFESLTGRSSSEWVGLDPVGLAVIETDGEWEQADSLKTAYDGAPATGLDIFRHGADEVAATPALSRRRRGLAGLCDTCRACPVVGQCGGGLFAHRWRTGAGFDNPSVYCADLKELTRHMNASQPPPAPVGLDTDLLPQELFDRLATGAGDAAAVRRLAAAQLDITRALLVTVADATPPGSIGHDGWQLLGDLDRHHPQAVRDVLAHPYLRTWAVDCLAAPPAARGPAQDHLAAIAAAAAVRAGVPAKLRLPVRDGRVHLPSLGVLSLAADGDEAIVQLDGGFDGEGGWQPARRLTADGGAVSVTLEDSDPYRDCHDWKAGDRLDDHAAGRWAGAFRAAWRIMEDEAPDRADSVREGLRAIVPLPATAGENSRASTARQAFGGIATTFADPSALAVTLVHEFAHNKLNALLDVCDLVDTRSPVKIKVGWRPDPRPVEGVLHGIYAHAAVAGIWRVRAERGAEQAAEHHRLYQDWTDEAVLALLGAGALTPAGDRLVRLLAESMAGRAR